MFWSKVFCDFWFWLGLRLGFIFDLNSLTLAVFDEAVKILVASALG